MSHRVNTVLWRVVFSAVRPRPGNAADFGPWQPDRGRAEAWSKWFREQGVATRIQDSNGDLYDGQHLVKANAPL
ncbi:hypothetical protein [Rubrivivax gelatinosus]|uniref:hypothetical protein n=1 Tax=Rubrivivax gelatinosus TaxID=28068 RepID=UPI0005C1D15F|nr:hypothetical protein [Rubrivivax gelatinosus]MBG6082996.1 hypothetical protein [Rubrivivax gelatinosus]